MIVITQNPTGKTYKNLLDFAFDYCDEFQLVVRKRMGSLRQIEPVLASLENSLISVKEQSSWAGTQLGGSQKARVYRYRTDASIKKTLKSIANSFYDWQQPDLPEDLSFFKKGKPFLVCTAHEHDSYFLTDSSYFIEKISAIDGLKIQQRDSEGGE